MEQDRMAEMVEEILNETISDDNELSANMA